MLQIFRVTLERRELVDLFVIVVEYFHIWVDLFDPLQDLVVILGHIGVVSGVLRLKHKFRDILLRLVGIRDVSVLRGCCIDAGVVQFDIHRTGGCHGQTVFLLLLLT